MLNFHNNYENAMSMPASLQEEFEAILDSSFDGIHITDGQGVTLFYNKACERIEGLNKEEVIGVNVQRLVDQGVYPNSLALKVLETKMPMTQLQKVNGKEIMVSAKPIFINGQITRVVMNSRDITELNLLKQELSHEKMIKEQYQTELEFIRTEKMPSHIVCESLEMQKMMDLIFTVSNVDSSILIQGESGVGKEVISRFIHKKSKRKEGPFIKIDCGAIPENLLESELFGYEKGAFTGADKNGKVGLIELAHGGTLFLDEIGELQLSLQVKLLRVLQDREVVRVGGKAPIKVDIRIIAATNKELEKMIKDKTFREDLYYRLNVVPLNVPPLRERKRDIYPLIQKVLKKFNEKYSLQKEIHPDAIKLLIDYEWPGNIRELENVIERLVVTSKDNTIDLERLPANMKRENKFYKPDSQLSYKEVMEAYEREFLKEKLAKVKNIARMAEELKIDESTVRRKLKKLNIPVKSVI
ncbi:PAS domain S-box-containing protein [Evansella vedderi]|uniref:PAS domain S-box-containing protein n=1 Tax=Evansella vedderi TaxID=38282 RepID=A0ABT9ZQK1_9BACI|nr:sigma 54-interacting transcriptional regulator [Evansella vedderi]MDQ0253002.1 PAS domain S-box-containing protein [Evansella vedderi]